MLYIDPLMYDEWGWALAGGGVIILAALPHRWTRLAASGLYVALLALALELPFHDGTQGRDPLQQAVVDLGGQG